MRIVRNGAPLARALSVAACVGLAAGGCDVGNKPEPPYKDPPPNQRIKSRDSSFTQVEAASRFPMVAAARQT